MKTPHNDYAKIGMTAFAVIACSILFFFSLFRIDAIGSALQTFGSILMPFIIGFVLAYLLLPVHNFVYRFLLPRMIRLRNAESKGRALTRILSAFASVIFLLLVLTTLLSMVLPSLVSSIVGLADSLDEYLITIEAWIMPFINDSVILQQNFTQAYTQFASWLTDWVQGEMLPQMILLMSGGLVSTMNLIKNMFVGVIITIYMLIGKDNFKAQAKKAVYALCKPEFANMLLHNMRYTHRVFGGFISGKLLDSLIIGVITFVSLTILEMPYVMLISVIIGVTNIIPFFGPFIGGVPAGLLILIVDPIKCIYFVVFILILQQFDGNILGPKILGDSTGLSSFWVMFSILVFGGMFGFTGMLFGVPLFAVLYSLISAMLNRRLHHAGLPETTESYCNLDHIDEHTGEMVASQGKRDVPQSVKIIPGRDKRMRKGIFHNPEPEVVQQPDAPAATPSQETAEESSTN